MSNDALILYGDDNWTSPYVFSCFVALREKALPFEMRLLNLARKETFEAAYLHSSLTGRVPALVHGDFWLSESSAIVEYLEDAFPAPGHPAIYPPSPRDRARARQLQAWVRSDLGLLREQRPTTVIFAHERPRPFTPPGETAAAHLLKVVDRVLAPGASTVFEHFSIVDVDLSLMLHRLIVPGDPVPDRLRTYAEQVWSRPSVREFVEKARPRH
jgi:glutathione S-transferase